MSSCCLPHTISPELGPSVGSGQRPWKGPVVERSKTRRAKGAAGWLRPFNELGE